MICTFTNARDCNANGVGDLNDIAAGTSDVDVMVQGKLSYAKAGEIRGSKMVNAWVELRVTDVAALIERRHPAQQRLAIEELLAHNLSMQQLHHRQRQFRAHAMAASAELENRFVERLPFRLTAAQQRVIEEIRDDLARDHPMQRLVQGDVGSGKTVVAAMAALRAIGNGLQTALMAPTELLAEQHLRSFRDWLLPLGIDPVWLSSKVTGRRRREALEAIAAGTPLVIGTHALMQEGQRQLVHERCPDEFE